MRTVRIALLAERAKELLETNVDIVVFGHTHQPDRRDFNGRFYFNPGSWTRYVELGPMSKLTMEDLRNESRVPYALNCVWIEESDAGNLRGQPGVL